MQTTHKKILKFLEDNPYSWYAVSDFQKQDSPCFIGYEAGTRLCDLMRKGLIQSRWSEKMTVSGRHVKEYSFIL